MTDTTTEFETVCRVTAHTLGLPQDLPWDRFCKGQSHHTPDFVSSVIRTCEDLSIAIPDDFKPHFGLKSPIRHPFATAKIEGLAKTVVLMGYRKGSPEALDVLVLKLGEPGEPDTLRFVVSNGEQDDGAPVDPADFSGDYPDLNELVYRAYEIIDDNPYTQTTIVL